VLDTAGELYEYKKENDYRLLFFKKYKASLCVLCIKLLIHRNVIFREVSKLDMKFNNRDPVYVQVIRYFKEQIAKGFFEPGQEIPSRRELASQLKINPNTAQRAYKEMEEQKLIFTKGNMPSCITRDEEILKGVREELIIETVDIFLSSIKSINMPLSEVLEIVKKKHDAESKGTEEPK